jgi:hypothetical protein
MRSCTGSGNSRKSLRLDPTQITGLRGGSFTIGGNIVISLYHVEGGSVRAPFHGAVISWPSGRTEEYKNLPAGRYTCTEGKGIQPG